MYSYNHITTTSITSITLTSSITTITTITNIIIIIIMTIIFGLSFAVRELVRVARHVERVLD